MAGTCKVSTISERGKFGDFGAGVIWNIARLLGGRSARGLCCEAMRGNAGEFVARPRRCEITCQCPRESIRFRD